MTTIDPAQALLSIADSLHNARLPPLEARAFFVRAVRAWIDGVPLEVACQLRPGAASYATRNDALRQAGALLDNDPARLAGAIARHPRHRNAQDPLHRAISEAEATGRRLPTSRKQLARILAAA